MNETSVANPSPVGVRGLRLLNFGCGSMTHPEWTNVDMAPTLPWVIAHDIRRPFPFAVESYDAVYGSHVLEHIDPELVGSILGECFRILKPGGVLRVAVPDLEIIARTYLQALEQALEGNREWQARYDWLMLELYDQCVRTSSGGRMGVYLARGLESRFGEFVRTRIGVEGFPGVAAGTPAAPPRGLVHRIIGRLQRDAASLRRLAAEGCVAMLLGRDAVEGLRQGLFRCSGEVHQWMYDRFSLGRALERAGFQDIAVRAADDSAIPGFPRFGLETIGGIARKPDSLFMEGRKPVLDGASIGA